MNGLVSDLVRHHSPASRSRVPPVRWVKMRDQSDGAPKSPQPGPHCRRLVGSRGGGRSRSLRSGGAFDAELWEAVLH
jgi:hypothetical protein